MSAHPSAPPLPRPLRGAPLLISVGLLLAVAAGLGCVRTTSIGRAGGAPTDGYADRDTDTTANIDAIPAPDLPFDAAVDQGPIVGGGRDATTDGPDGPDDADPDAAP